MSTYATTLLPNGEQVFLDNNGVPLAGGFVHFYIPNTSTDKDTWQNAGQSVLNLNPVQLDSSGRAIIYGNGLYRQVVQDSLLNTIWDQLTGSDQIADPVTSVYDFVVYISGAPSAGLVFPVFRIARALSLPVSLTASVFGIVTNPTSALSVTLKKNASNIGSISFSTSGVATVTFNSLITFAAGDTFSLTFPNPADATGANIEFTFVFSVG